MFLTWTPHWNLRRPLVDEIRQREDGLLVSKLERVPQLHVFVCHPKLEVLRVGRDGFGHSRAPFGSLLPQQLCCLG